MNLEKALKQGDDISGHVVTGHVDGIGVVQKIEKKRKNWILFIKTSKAIMRLLAPKASVACDGISLTVQENKGSQFKIAIIPHTLQETTLGLKKKGSTLNIEVDILMRYATFYLEKKKKRSRSPKRQIQKLIKQGF